MHKDLAKRFYKSKRWLTCRATYIGDRRLIDGGMCEICRKRIGHHVDHIIEIDIVNINNPDITLNPDNLQYLCVPCHNRKTKGGQPIKFDESGRPMAT